MVNSFVALLDMTVMINIKKKKSAQENVKINKILLIHNNASAKANSLHGYFNEI